MEEEFRKNTKLIYLIIHKYHLEKDIDDYFQIGSMGLIKAIKNFDKRKNYKKSTYYTKCISNEILLSIRKDKAIKRQQDTISLHTPITDNLCLEDVLKDDTNQFKEIEESEVYQIILNKINNSKYKEIIYKYYGLNGYKRINMKELAEEMNISQSYVSRIIQKCINEIRKDLKEKEIL